MMSLLKLEASSMPEIIVHVDRPYPVIVESGASKRIAQFVRPDAERVAILHAPTMSNVARKLELDQATYFFELPDAEAAKTSEVLVEIWNSLGGWGFTRSDVIIALGGGATTDIAGFTAASWLRGIDVVQVPTSLLAMVDAAVGGKTGINTAAGKNLVGAFHHPRAVIVDTDFLHTLPQRDLIAGAAEIIKCGFIAEARILEAFETHGNRILHSESQALLDVIAYAIEVKAAVVADDFTESKVGGLGREVLNYCHTLGHAIERETGYTIRHGEAISVGMMFAAKLSQIHLDLSQELLQRHKNIFSEVGLPIKSPKAEWAPLLQSMSLDKKARGNTLRFIGLRDVGRCEVISNPSEASLIDAFGSVT